MEAGCLMFLFTGGEPLLRHDFEEIYLHAKRSGLIVTVFTNGTLVTKRLAALFHDWPPRDVDISLYGATAKTYERVTGVTGSFDRCRAGIEQLLAQGVRVTLKTVLMTLNANELSAMEALAASYSVKFRLDTSVFPRLNHDREPLDYRLTPQQAAASEMANPERLARWRALRASGPAPATVGNRLYNCAAGRSTFHIDATGHLKPCLMLTHAACNLRTSTFREGWNTAVAQAVDTTVNSRVKCASCQVRQWCGYCPEYVALDAGERQSSSDWLCGLAQARLEIVAAEEHRERT